MSDDKINRGQPDRSRIAMGQTYEVQFWTKDLKVTEQQLQAAVSAVRNSADAVRRHLRQQQGWTATPLSATSGERNLAAVFHKAPQ
jgi:hypothetical protein